MATKSNKKGGFSSRIQFILILLFIPIVITVYMLAYFAWEQLKELPFIEELLHQETETEVVMKNFDLAIPVDYIPIYQAAAEEYEIHWPLLAAHHRIETRFSTLKKLLSPVGAEGHMQFMPCTFVGWQHPTCSGLGQGAIPESEKTSLQVIKKYGGYGVDGNGDGIADPYNIHDALYSAAKYLSHAGAKNGELTKAIFEYNHSNEYVADILYYYELYSSYEEQLVALTH